MENIVLTDDIIKSIQDLVKRFDGINNTEIITGVNRITIKKYLERKVDYIPNYIWNDKLLPYIQSVSYDKIVERIKILKKELTNCRKDNFNLFKENNNRIEKITKKFIDKEILEKAFDNPILSLNSDDVCLDVFMKLENFKKSITNLVNDKNYSKNELLFHMIEFKDIYDKFRPFPITDSDPYWGTVKKIEGVYSDLLKYIGMETLSRSFSKYNIEHYKEIYTYEKCNWNEILEEVDELIESVLLKIEERAFDLLCKLKNNTPHYCKNIIRILITRIHKSIGMEKINFDFDNDKIIIDKIKIEISYSRKMMVEIREL